MARSYPGLGADFGPANGWRQWQTELNEQDIKPAGQIARNPCFVKKPWQKEIELMLTNGSKREARFFSRTRGRILVWVLRRR